MGRSEQGLAAIPAQLAVGPGRVALLAHAVQQAILHQLGSIAQAARHGIHAAAAVGWVRRLCTRSSGGQQSIEAGMPTCMALLHCSCCSAAETC